MKKKVNFTLILGIVMAVIAVVMMVLGFVGSCAG